MKKSNSSWIKLAIITLVAIVLFFVVSIILLVTFVNPNKFKDQISTLVKQNTGREFVIAGDVNWSFFPWLGLRLNQLAMGNAPGFNQQAFAKVDEADVNVRLLPLFKGKVEFGKIVLRNPIIHLAKNAQGQTNWDDLTHSTKAAASSSKPKANNSVASPQTFSKLAALAIANIDITNATITWDNAQNKQSMVIDKFNLKTHDVTWGKPFPIAMDFHLTSNQPLIETNFKLTSNVIVDPRQQQYSLQKLKINGDLINKNYSHNEIPYQLETDIISNLSTQTVTAKNLELKFDNLWMKGDITGNKILQTPIFTGQITVDPFNLRNLLNDLGQKIAMQNANALTKVSLKTNTEFSSKYLKLTNLQGQLDQTTFNGHFSLADFNTKRFDFDLKMNAINLDDYSSKTATSNNSPATQTTAASRNTTAGNPFAALLGINGAGSLQIGKVTVNKLTLANFYTQIAAMNGVVKLAPISADLYQGKLQGAITVNAPAANVAVNNTLSNIQVGQLWQDLTPDAKYQLTGVGNVNAQLQTQGKTPNAMKQNLNGNIKFAITNGAIKNLNLNQQIFAAVNHLLKSNDSSSNDNETAFSSLTGTANIANGVVNNNDLLLKSNSLQVSGNGTANLVNEIINYRLKATATGEPFGRDIFDLQNQIGGSFPILISGTFSNPHVTPDLQSLASAFLKGQVKQQISKQIGKNINEDVGKVLQQGIQNFLGQ